MKPQIVSLYKAIGGPFKSDAASSPGKDSIGTSAGGSGASDVHLVNDGTALAICYGLQRRSVARLRPERPPGGPEGLFTSAAKSPALGRVTGGEGGGRGSVAFRHLAE